jgi:hypothetical protein
MSVPDPALERARKRAKDMRDFYRHVIIYVIVCTFLVLIDLTESETVIADRFIGLDWAYWPIFGWGAFVVLHGVSTFSWFGGWEERKAQELYEREKERELTRQ